MRNAVLSFALLLVCLTTVPAFATVISGSGTHTSLPTNCGFEVPTGPGGTMFTGWLSVKMSGDTSYADVLTLAGPYPLSIQEIALYGAPVGPSSVTLIDPPCTGIVYHHAFNMDEQCETDPNRPAIADADQVPPGPDLPYNEGWIAGGTGDIDYLTGAQGDYGEYWNTFRAHGGEIQAVANHVRRCRYVDDNGIYFMTLIWQ